MDSMAMLKQAKMPALAEREKTGRSIATPAPTSCTGYAPTLLFFFKEQSVPFLRK